MFLNERPHPRGKNGESKRTSALVAANGGACKHCLRTLQADSVSFCSIACKIRGGGEMTPNAESLRCRGIVISLLRIRIRTPPPPPLTALITTIAIRTIRTRAGVTGRTREAAVRHPAAGASGRTERRECTKRKRKKSRS